MNQVEKEMGQLREEKAQLASELATASQVRKRGGAGDERERN